MFLLFIILFKTKLWYLCFVSDILEIIVLCLQEVGGDGGEEEAWGRGEWAGVGAEEAAGEWTPDPGGKTQTAEW